jgi:hypothetical protein
MPWPWLLSYITGIVRTELAASFAAPISIRDDFPDAQKARPMVAVRLHWPCLIWVDLQEGWMTGKLEILVGEKVKTAAVGSTSGQRFFRLQF